jgi:hypothetical protein
MTPLLWSANPFILSAMICPVMVFLGAAKRSEIALAAVLGVILGNVFRIPADMLPVQVMIWFSWWSIGGLLITTAGIYCTRTGRSSRMRLMRNMALGPVAALIGNILVVVSTGLRPFTLDRYLYAADGSFGFQPGFAAGALLLRHQWLNLLCGLAYVNLPVLIMTVYLLVDRRNPADASRFIRLLTAVGLAGYCLYYFFPAAGSAVVFGSRFPFHPPDIASLSLEPVRVEPAPRNFMPSLHTAWCIVICWSARGLTRFWRTIIGVILGFTLLATLACHYFVDMIAAVPFTLAVYGLVENRLPRNHPARRLAFCAGAACFGTWLIVLRFGTALLLISPVISWTACALTAALCWSCLYREPSVGGSASAAKEENPSLAVPPNSVGLQEEPGPFATVEIRGG